MNNASSHVREVQVRQIDDKVGGAQSLSPTAAATTPNPSSSPSSSVPVLVTLSHTLLFVLDGDARDNLTARAIATQLHESVSLAGSAPACVLFSDRFARDIPDLALAHILDRVHAGSGSALADAAAANPTEYYLLSSWILSLVELLPANSYGLHSAVTFLCGILARIAHRDAFHSTSLFADFTLSKLVKLLRGQPAKIAQASRVMYASTADTVDAHQRMLHRAREEVGVTFSGDEDTNDDISVRLFLSILSALAPYEHQLLLPESGSLLATYTEFVRQGMSSRRTARTRAVSLSVFVAISGNPNYGADVLGTIVDAIRPLLPAISSSEPSESEQEGVAGTGRGLANDEWCIDAELLHIFSCVLSHASTPAQMLSDIYAWIGAILEPPGSSEAPESRVQAPFVVVRSALAHLSHALGGQPALRKAWMKALLDDDALRARLLRREDEEEDEETEFEAEYERDIASSASSSTISPSARVNSTPLSRASLLSMFCPRLRSSWHALTVAQTFADMVRVSSLDNFKVQHVELLQCVAEDAFGAGAVPINGATPAPAPAFPDSEASEWCRIFLSLRDNLVVELCDHALAASVVDILRRFLFDARTTGAAQTIFHPNVTAADPKTPNSQPQKAPAPLYCIMRYIWPGADELTQHVLTEFLEELSAISTFIRLVHKNIQMFAQSEPEKFQNSTLVPLLTKLDQLAAEAGQ